MSSLISSFYNNPVTQENASIGFKPKELRPKQTQADVNKRLLNYHTHNTTNNTTNTARRRSTSTDRTTHATYTTGTHVHSEGKGLSMEDYQEVESLISLTPIVLYYCSCLVAKMPGTCMYLLRVVLVLCIHLLHSKNVVSGLVVSRKLSCIQLL